jgi:gluconate 2-dehydrogenase alpha chain
VNVDNNGRVTGVTYVKGTEIFFQPASVVLLATYTYENVRTLLLSKSKAFPNGLANNRGQVGRHYMTHATGGSVQALFPENLNNWYGLPAQGVGVDDFADDNFDHSSLDFIGGGNLFVYSDRRPIAAASMTTFGKAPQWGRRGRRSSSRTPIGGTARTCRRPRCRTRTTISISIPR